MNDIRSTLLARYGCGPVQLSGTDAALYERHLLFDNVIDPAAATAREQFEAIARSVRDVISQRWLLTEKTYQRENPKRAYYLSIEYLLGRSLVNNVINAGLAEAALEAMKSRHPDPALVEAEPDAGLGNGGLGRLAACFLDSMATLELPAMGYGLRYEYGIFRQTLRDGWQHEQPDNWLRHPDPWEVPRLSESVEVKLDCSVELRAGRLHPIAGRPAVLLGIPYDRPVIGYGGRTINTLRLWAAATPDTFDFQQFSRGDFVGALAEALASESVTRVLYPDDSTSMGQELRFVQEYFLVACSLGDLVRRFRRANSDWRALPLKVAIQMNDTHPAMAVPELMRILLDDAGLDWDTAWDLTRRSLAYTNHTLLPSAGEVAAQVVRGPVAAPGRDRLRGEPPLPRRGRRPFPGRWRARRTHEHHRGRGRAQSAHGRPGDRGLAQHERRLGDPFEASANARREGPGRDVSGALQQQDQRRHAAALAARATPRASSPPRSARADHRS